MKRLTAQNYGNDDGEECLRSVFKNGQNSFSLARLLTEFPCMEFYFLVHEHLEDLSISGIDGEWAYVIWRSGGASLF